MRYRSWHQVSYSILLHLIVFNQSLTDSKVQKSPRLASKPQESTCFILSNVKVTGMCWRDPCYVGAGDPGSWPTLFVCSKNLLTEPSLQDDILLSPLRTSVWFNVFQKKESNAAIWMHRVSSCITKWTELCIRIHSYFSINTVRLCRATWHLCELLNYKGSLAIYHSVTVILNQFSVISGEFSVDGCASFYAIVSCSSHSPVIALKCWSWDSTIHFLPSYQTPGEVLPIRIEAKKGLAPSCPFTVHFLFASVGSWELSGQSFILATTVLPYAAAAEIRWWFF